MLKSVEEYNAEKMEKWKTNNDIRTGVACKDCGAELLYIDPNSVLLSYPPKKQVRCSECQNVSSILA